MASAADLRALEALVDWEDDAFRDGLAELSEDTAAESRAFARRARVIAGMAAKVPRCPFDDKGATPWTSFRREVAVARQQSDQAAALEIRTAVRLVTALPQMLGLLERGTVTVPRARAFVAEVERCEDDVAALLDADLAQRCAGLPPWRIAQDVRKAVLRLQPEAAALRTATKNADRGILLLPDADDQATVSVFGPAVAVTRWHAALDQRARALKQAGDPRTLDQLRFDLATGTFPCATHAPADPTAPTGEHPGATSAGVTADDTRVSAHGLRPGFVEPAEVDCRRTRPVQAMVTVPVETALGLSNEPAWLDGYGWLSAPTVRTLLVDAELRQVCVQSGTGAVVDLDLVDRRPPPTPSGVRDALLEMVVEDWALTEAAVTEQARHDPDDWLATLVRLRDVHCDGPTGARVPAARADLDHEQRWPEGPTAAWNLVARSRRTHGLKHRGWTPLRTPTSTIWFSPAGQVAVVPHHADPSPGADADPHADAHARAPGGAGAHAARLPDPDELAALDLAQLTAPREGDSPPWLRGDPPPEPVAWTWLEADEPCPF